MAVFAFGVVVAPVLGPTLGGYLTDTYSWRYAFYINIPIGILALYMINKYVKDPSYIRDAKPARFDNLGFGALIVWVGCLQVILDKGQEVDWFGATWVRWAAFAMVVAFAVFIYQSFWGKDPLVNLRILKNRNFLVGSILIFLFGIAIYSTVVVLPLFYQELLGYTAFTAGLVVAPRGLGAICGMPVIGYLSQPHRPALSLNLRLRSLRPNHALLRLHHAGHLALDALPPHPHHRLRSKLRLRPHQHRRLRHPLQRANRQRQRPLQPHAQRRRQHRHLHRHHPLNPPHRRPPERPNQRHGHLHRGLRKRHPLRPRLPQHPLRPRQLPTRRPGQHLPPAKPASLLLGLRRHLPLALPPKLRLRNSSLVLQKSKTRQRPRRSPLEPFPATNLSSRPEARLCAAAERPAVLPVTAPRGSTHKQVPRGFSLGSHRPASKKGL